MTIRRLTQKRSPIYGIGINDSDYNTQPIINGKKTMCLFYRKWIGMFVRCYSLSALKSHPTYSDCFVAEEWYSFMSFRTWMENQDWQEKELDKDIITPGNKIYSPETCCFVSRSINALLNSHGRSRGPYPQGVAWNALVNKFHAKISINGKRKHLGYFVNPLEAANAYNKSKAEIIINISINQPTIIKNGLLLHAELFLKQLA